jgi:hypothetical protein
MFLEFEWGGVSTRFMAAAAAEAADGWFAKSGILG